MPLTGGASDKYGNRYEGRWTITCMIKVMSEQADSIRLEPPGEDGEGAEFWLRTGENFEYHQVKRQHGASGRWTVSELEEKRVLTHFLGKLQNPHSQCVFVSLHAAYQLDELADRARKAASWVEFEKEFSAADAQNRPFNEIHRIWALPSPPETYEFLKRIRVRTVDEETLRTMVESQLDALVEGAPATIMDILAEFILENVHIELTAHDIWQHLEERGHRRRQWGNDPRTLAAVSAANQRYLGAIRAAAIFGEMIERTEVNTVVDRLTSAHDQHQVLVTGQAGVGKSGVLLEIIDNIRDRGWPTLAFRIDRVHPAVLPDDLGQQLGLPGSPATVLAAIAQGRDCLLVIDQLDAVSLTSGRHPEFFDCIYEIIKQALAHPQMRLILSCREFDFNNDHRLRGLGARRDVSEPIAVQPLSNEIVHAVVERLGMDFARLNERQRRLLTLPLHLSLLVELANEPVVHNLHFATAKDLFDQFWDRKQRIIRERLGRPVQWIPIVDLLCDYMSQHQILSAPQEILDEYINDAEVMASEHVLVLEQRRFAFFHEGFFDYTFARRFAARGNELLTFLRSSEQHLFRRAQVRQVLIHERDADRNHYLADLQSILSGPDIRFHLNQVVFAVLSQLEDPTLDEWRILNTFVGDIPNPLEQEVWRMLRGAIPWFDLLDSQGLVEHWLVAEEAQPIDQATMFLLSVQKERADRVAELIEPYIGTSEAWSLRLQHFMQWADLNAGRRFIELFLRLVDEGELDNVRGPIAINSDFWSLILSLVETRPDWACEVIGHYLNRRLTLSTASGQPNPFDSENGTIGQSQHHDYVFGTSANAASTQFVHEVLPFMLQVMEQTTVHEGNPPWQDMVWRHRYPGRGYAPTHSLLVAMESAMSSLAATEPEAFRHTAARLRNLDLETAQFLLVRAYAADGPQYADEAMDYLLEKPTALESGYISDTHWATRELLRAVTPYCSEERLAHLENLILDYYPEWETRPKHRGSRGYGQFELLDGIDSNRRSEIASHRLEEWRRKFLVDAPSPPMPVTVGVVASPISEESAIRMTDDQWLSAITRYADDELNLRRAGSFHGGALQLAGVLRTCARREPVRFAALLHGFSETTHPAYFAAVLEGTADTELDIDALIPLWHRCHELADHPCGLAICESVMRMARHSLPDNILSIIGWYALGGLDLEQAEPTVQVPIDHWVRARAVETIGALIEQDSNRVAQFLPIVQGLVTVHSDEARLHVAAPLIALLKSDRELAVNLFLQYCEAEFVLSQDPYVEQFLYFALSTHFDALLPLLTRMLNSENAEVAIMGARQICLTSLVQEAAQPIAESCLSGTLEQRKGVAEIYAANVNEAAYRRYCEERLVRLFNDDNEAVRSEAARCFRTFEASEIGDQISLIEAFVQSPTFVTEHGHVIDALRKSTATLPDITYLVCERFLDIAGADAADIRTRSAVEAEHISQLIVRLYSQSRNDEMQTRCLNLIDHMTQLHIIGLDKVFSSYER